MLEKIVQKKIFGPLGIKGPKCSEIILWLIWFAASLYLLEFRLSDNPLGVFESAIEDYIFGILLMAILFYDKGYVFENFFKEKKLAYRFPFMINIALLLGVVIGNKLLFGATSDYAKFVAELGIIYYWMLSIMLVIISNKKIWIITAVSIYFSCIAYVEILNDIAMNPAIHTNIHLWIGIAVTIVVLFVSVFFVKRKIKKIFDM